jgi:hypothetical protein
VAFAKKENNCYIISPAKDDAANAIAAAPISGGLMM